MVLFAFSTVVFAHKEKVRSNLSKLVLVVWFLVVLIITQSYTASLASMLTVQKLQPTVTDVNVLLKNKDYVGYMEGSFILGLKKMTFDDSRLIQYKSMEQLDELLSKGSGNGGISAGFHEVPYIKLFLSKYCPNYTMVDALHKADGFGFVFPKGSPLVPHVSRAILQVTEGPKMVEIEKKWLGNDNKCPDPDSLRSPQSLGIESFWALFVIVGLFGVGALVIYVIRSFFFENDNNGHQAINWEGELANGIVELVRRLHNNIDQGINHANPNANLNANPNGNPTQTSE